MRLLLLVLVVWIGYLLWGPSSTYHYEYREKIQRHAQPLRLLSDAPLGPKMRLASNSAKLLPTYQTDQRAPAGDKINSQLRSQFAKVSWYARGLRDPERFTAACWDEIPKGTLFKVTSGDNSVVVTCDDRGHFKEMGRYLDLSSGAFRQLAPLTRGVITVSVQKIDG